MNRRMVSRTYHVFAFQWSLIVKKEGASAETYRTRREAIKAARTAAKKSNPAQLVVYARDGSMRGYENYGLIPIQDPPKKSRLAARIDRAVGKVTLERLLADLQPSSRAVPRQE